MGRRGPMGFDASTRMATGKELVAWAGANGAAVNAIRHGSLKIKRKGRSAAKPQPKTLPLLHRMKEKTKKRRQAWLDCWESLLSSVLPMNPWENRTSNIQHPTSNTQPAINGPIGNHWLFDVKYWVLD